MLCYRPIANVNNFSQVLRCLGKVTFGVPGIADVRAWTSVNIMYSAILYATFRSIFFVELLDLLSEVNISVLCANHA
jgi:hypothetical protein